MTMTPARAPSAVARWPEALPPPGQAKSIISPISSSPPVRDPSCKLIPGIARDAILQTGDLEQQFAAYRLGEAFVAVGGDDESARTADDQLGESGLQIVGDGPAADAFAAKDGEAVDDDAGGEGMCPGLGDRDATPAIGTVAGEIDHQPGAVDIVALDQGVCRRDGVADGIGPKGEAGLVQQPPREGGGAVGAVDHGPGHHHFL